MLPTIAVGRGGVRLRPQIGPSAVVVRDVLVEYPFQVTPGEHERVVDALFSDGAHPTLRDVLDQVVNYSRW